MNERASTTVVLAGRILPEGYASRLGQVITGESMAQLFRPDPVMPEILAADRSECGTKLYPDLADHVTLAVTDQGKGIPHEDIEKIFEKFYRRAKGDGRAAGTGPGFSIARGFIAAMGGSITAERPATRKRGTRFLVRVPAIKSGVA